MPTFGGPLLKVGQAIRRHVNGQRTSTNQMAGVTILLDQTQESRGPFTGVATAIRMVQEITPNGVNRRETREWHIPRAQIEAAAIPVAPENAKVTDHDGEWNVDVGQCVWREETDVVLALIRKPRTSGNELRRSPS